MDTMQRVEAGAAVLDVKVPDWFGYINLDTLNIDRFEHCIIGQLNAATVFETDAPEYPWAAFDLRVIELLELPADEADSYFYRTSAARQHGFQGAGYRHGIEVTQAWRELILARRAEAGE